MSFNEWFENSLTIGSFPILVDEYFDASLYDVIINVSDEFYPDIDNKIREVNNKCSINWFPMNEVKSIGLNSIYGAIVIMYNAEKQNKKVYLHCHAGVNRSKSVQAAYHFFRTGEHLYTNEGGYINRFVGLCSRGYLPPKLESEKFLLVLASELENSGIYGGILDNCKLDSLKS